MPIVPHEGLSAESARLLRLADTQAATIRDHEVAHCWRAVIQSIWLGWLSPGVLPTLVDALTSAEPWHIGECWIELADDDAGRLEVTLVAEHWQCPRKELVTELQRLLSGYGAEPTEPP